MLQPGPDYPFWIAVMGATIVKLASSPYRSLYRAVLTGFAAVFTAYVFTDPVVSWLRADPGTYRIAIAALLTLTGEGLMRTVIDLSNDPKRLLDWWKSWKG